MLLPGDASFHAKSVLQLHTNQLSDGCNTQLHDGPSGQLQVLVLRLALWHRCSMCFILIDDVCTAAASGRMQLKKKTPTRPSIQQLQGGMSAMGL